MDAQHLTLPADLTKKRRPVKKCLTFPGNYPRHIPVVRCVGTPGLQQAPVFPGKAKRRSIMHLSPDSLPRCKSCISVCSGRESAANAIMPRTCLAMLICLQILKKLSSASRLQKGLSPLLNCPSKKVQYKILTAQ